jgi:hypothetical protein
MSGLGPFDVDPIIERLRAQVPALKLVGGAAERAEVEQSTTLTTPAAFVILASEQIDITEAGGLYIHRIRAEIHVLYQVRHYREGARGQPHRESLAALVGAGRAALNNWRPAGPAGATVEHVHGSGRAVLLGIRQRDAWWLDPFELVYRGSA